MDATKILSNFKSGEMITKDSFRKAAHSLDPDLSETSINWMIHILHKKDILASAGSGKYYLMQDDTKIKRKYHYPHSAEFLELEKLISENYPYLDFQMWELIQLNDFVNHQISKNVIIIEADNMMTDTVYETIHEKYPYAMYKPDMDAFFRQRAPQTDVIIQRMITESPKSDDVHSSPLEKILVDLMSKKLTGNLVEHSEYKRIFEDVFEKYIIDETKMFRYARRRNLYDPMISFIRSCTDIKLKTL